MRTKTAITDSELAAFRIDAKEYDSLQVRQDRIALDVAERLGCDVHDAVDLLNDPEHAEQILSDNGLEIAPDDRPSLRVVDYEEETYFPRTIGSVEIVLAGCAIACFIAVIAGVGVAWDWVFGEGW